MQDILEITGDPMKIILRKLCKQCIFPHEKIPYFFYFNKLLIFQNHEFAKDTKQKVIFYLGTDSVVLFMKRCIVWKPIYAT